MPAEEPEEMTSRVGVTGDYLVITIQKVEKPIDDDSLNGTVRTNESEHWVFEIGASKEFIQRPFNAGASVQGFKQSAGITPEAPYLEPDEGTLPVPLVDQNGNDVLRNDNDDWFVYHGTVAPLQDKLRVYPQIPDSQPEGVFQYLSSRRPAPTEGDVVGYEDGKDVENFYDPKTGINEFIAWNEEGSTSLSFGMYNSDQENRIVPRLSITGAGYSLSPVLNEAERRSIVTRAFNGDESVVHFQWGAIRDSFTYDVPDEWTDANNVVENLGAFDVESRLKQLPVLGDSGGDE